MDVCWQNVLQIWKQLDILNKFYSEMNISTVFFTKN